MLESRSAVVVDRGSSFGDSVLSRTDGAIEADVPIEGERGPACVVDRVPRMLFMSEEWVMGPTAALSAGSKADFGRSPLGMIGCDLDLLPRLPDRALASCAGRSAIDHGPAPRIALEQGPRGIFDCGCELMSPARGQGLDRAAAKAAALMAGAPMGPRAEAREIPKAEI